MCDFDSHVAKYFAENNIELYEHGYNGYVLVKDGRVIFLKKDYTLYQEELRIHTNLSLYDNVFISEDEEYYDIARLFDIQIMITERLKNGYVFKLCFENENGDKHKQNYLTIIVKDEFYADVDYTNIDEINHIMDTYDDVFENKKMIVLKFVD